MGAVDVSLWSRKICSDFSNQLRWTPSAGAYDIFHQKFGGGQGHMMDNQDSEMGSPDPSLSHRTTAGNPSAPWPEQQLFIHCSLELRRSDSPAGLQGGFTGG